MKEEGDEDEEEEEERLAEEKLKQLQQLAEKSTTERRKIKQSPSSSSSNGCLKSSWQQIDTLMLYTAAGVKGSDMVRPHGNTFFHSNISVSENIENLHKIKHDRFGIKLKKQHLSNVVKSIFT